MSLAQALPVTAAAQQSLPRGRVALCRFAWGVLAYNIAVILWGALVRATGSGAGCGDHWPLCNGVVIQAHPRIATIIELTHRMTSGIAVIAILALLIWTFRATPRKHLARASVVAATVLTFNEALLGALLVLLRLTADNRSGERAVYLSLHLANTLLLLAALALCAHFSSRQRDFLRGTVHFSHLALGLVGLAATLAVGVSGSLAALGDTLYPAATLRAAFAADFSQQSSWLLRLRFIHPLSALIAGLFICWLVVRTVFRRSGPGNRGLGLAVVLLLLLQIGLGLADVLLLAPVWMQIAHLLGADLLWIALVVLTARVCISGASKTTPLFAKPSISA
jgi:cytochrome c oxidase assembly protein subunit 15